MNLFQLITVPCPQAAKCDVIVAKYTFKMSSIGFVAITDELHLARMLLYQAIWQPLLFLTKVHATSTTISTAQPLVSFIASFPKQTLHRRVWPQIK